MPEKMGRTEKQNDEKADVTSMIARFEKNRNLKPGENTEVELALVPFEGGGLRLV